MSTNGFSLATGLIISPKGKNSKSTKKVTKGRVPQKLFDEKSNYEKEKPLLRKQGRKKSSKKPPPPLPVEVEKSEESDTEETMFEHIDSEQMTSEQQESKHAESEEHNLDSPDFKEHESGQPESKGPSPESPYAEQQDYEESLIWEIWLNARTPKFEMALGGKFPKHKKSSLMGFTKLTKGLLKGQSLKNRGSTLKC